MTGPIYKAKIWSIYAQDIPNIYRSKISVRYEGPGGLIGTERAKGI